MVRGGSDLVWGAAEERGDNDARRGQTRERRWEVCERRSRTMMMNQRIK